MSEHVLAADHGPHTGNGRGVVPVSVVTAASQSALQAQTRPLAVGVDSLYLNYFIEPEGIDFEELRSPKETLLARFHSPELWTADVRAKIAALELGL